MGAIGEKKYLWISNVLPMSVVEKLGLSVAGKKMELSLLRGFEAYIDCDVLSVSAQGKAESEECSFELWENKKYSHIAAEGNFAPIANRKFEKKIFGYVKAWCEKNKEYEKSVIVVNSPLFVTRPLVKLKKKYSLSLFSITVDLPRLNKSKNIKNAILNFYNRSVFRAGHRTLSSFDGLIGVNENTKKALNLLLPFHKMLIGIDSIPQLDESVAPIAPYKVAFAGTLIDYNGIEPLMDAVASLDKGLFELHIFGYGPLEKKVTEYCGEYDNFYFHGQIPNSEMMSVLTSMDILVNPRVVNLDISDYTFPSKIVEYLSTGKAVITTRFSSMPPEYEEFVFAIEQATPSLIAQKLMEIVSLDKEELSKRSSLAREFVCEKHSYGSICLGITNFIKGIS